MSLLIKGVQVVNGKGEEPYKADVLVQRNVISAIGNLKGKDTDKVIDGLGHYLAPGFIDVHNSADHYLGLFSNPAQENFIKQGITTIIGGHCGASLAPLLYGDLDSVRKWADPHDINIDWHTLKELRKTLERISVGVNFGTLVGHSTIRRALAGDRTRLLQRELDVFKGVLERSMNDGAFGISSGLGYVHGKSASKNEIRELIDIVRKFDGVYSVHLRNETKKIVESVKEIVDVVKGLQVRTVISHFRPIKGFEKEFNEASKIISETEDIYFDVYPYGISVRPLYTLLPEWAQVENIEAMLERVRSKKTNEFIEKDLSSLRGDDIVIGGAPHHEYLVGKTIGDIAQNLSMSTAKAALHIMDITNLRAVLFYKDVDETFLMDVLLNEKALIASHGKGVMKGEYMVHDRSVDSFPKYLKLVVGGGKLSLEEAVRRVTSRPAGFFGIRDRGVVKEGGVADLVLLDKSDYGVKSVVVGGKVFGEEPTKGEMLYHKR